MSKLLVILFAGAIVLLGFQPIEREYGSISNFATAMASKVGDYTEGFSVEKWARELERRDSTSRRSDYSVTPKKPNQGANSSPRDTTGKTSWFSRFLPLEHSAERNNQNPAEIEIDQPSDALTTDDREELNKLLGNF